MLQIGAGSMIYLAVQPVDFRKQMRGLSGTCHRHLKQDPLSDSVFVFVNKNRQMIRLMLFDGQGQWLCTKRFSQSEVPEAQLEHWGFRDFFGPDLYALR